MPASNRLVEEGDTRGAQRRADGGELRGDPVRMIDV